MSARSRPRRPVSRLPLWLRLTAVGVVVAIGLYSWQAAQRAARRPADDAPRVAFTVDGLDCPVWCAVRLSASIDGLDGAEVEVFDQKSGKVVVRHDPTRQNVEALRQLLDRRGFAVQAAEPVVR